MSDSNFDHTTHPFLQKAENPGFWYYAVTIADGIDRYFKLQQDRYVLERMSDHLLKDIGIGRGEIPDAILHRKLQERADDSGQAYLTNPVNIGIGKK